MPNLPSHPAQTLEPVDRFALAYTPDSARPAWVALILFKKKLAEVARPGRESLMIQLRLSWWRDRLSEQADRWPKSEPVLAQLKVWESEAAALVALVDGWEANIVGEDGGVELHHAEIEAYVALARLLGEPDLDAVRHMAGKVVEPDRRLGNVPRLSRRMRPLAIQHALAVRRSRDTRPSPVRDLVTLMRVGLLGR